MQLTHDDVRRLAQLARLKLTDSEVDRLSKQLTDILSYVDMLREVDTSGIPETSQVTGLVTVTRPDVVDANLATPDELLECSPLPKQDHQIRIKRIM